MKLTWPPYLNFEVVHDCCYARKFKFKCAFNNHRHFLLALGFYIGKTTTFVGKQKRWGSLFTHRTSPPQKKILPGFQFFTGEVPFGYATVCTTKLKNFSLQRSFIPRLVVCTVAKENVNDNCTRNTGTSTVLANKKWPWREINLFTNYINNPFHFRVYEQTEQ